MSKFRGKSTDLKNSINLLENHIEELKSSERGLKSILGIEGSAARIYFREMFSEFNWSARRPRVKHDIINSLMDIGYTLLFNMIEAMISIYGFDKYHGVYHQQFYQRKSLVCDLVEPFRPLIDLRIKKAMNLKQIHTQDFDIVQGQFRLFGKNAVPYITWLMEPLITQKDEMFLYIRNYYRAFMKNKPIDEYPFFKISEK